MKKEQQKVRAFYKEFLSWKAESIGQWIGAGFLEVLFGIMMMVPYQEMKEDNGFVVMPMLFGFLGAMLYIAPYLTFREEGNSVSIYEKIKYLPVDYRQIQKMRIWYLIRFVAKIFPILFLLQMATSYWSNTLTVANLIYVILLGLVWPILSNLPFAWLGK